MMLIIKCIANFSIYLHIVPCPEVTSLPVNITVLPGGVSQFICKAFSFHHLKYEWKRKDFAELPTQVTTLLKLDEQDLTAYSMLSIDKTDVTHEGWYCCVVTNECGDVKECAWLEVDSKLQPTIASYLASYFQ